MDRLINQKMIYKFLSSVNLKDVIRKKWRGKRRRMGGGLAQADHPLFFMNHLLGNPKVIENQLLLTHL